MLSKKAKVILMLVSMAFDVVALVKFLSEEE